MLLDPKRALYIPDHKTLIIADCHLGKTEHFRSEGIYLPDELAREGINRIQALLEKYLPERCIFLGDLYHKGENHEGAYLREIIRKHPKTEFILTKGNHDRHATLTDFPELEIVESYQLGPFLLTHHPRAESDLFNLHGHLHPAVQLTLPPKERIKLPCLYITKNSAILPAFNTFTGGSPQPIKHAQQIYAITPEEEIKRIKENHK